MAVNLSRQLIFDESKVNSLSELLTYQMTLDDARDLSYLREEIRDLYNMGRELFYIQVKAQGGTIPASGNPKYEFEDPVAKAAFEADLVSFLSQTESIKNAPQTVSVAGVPQSLKDALDDLITINEP